MSYRVLVVDDHPMFRMGLAYALRAKGFTAVGEASNGREALAWCRRESVDVVLMDVKMPVMDGIEACRAIAGLRASPVVVMLTFEEPAIIEAARAAGAVAYLSKEAESDQLAGMLTRVLDELDRGWMPATSLPRLTRRERQVLELLAGGNSNKRIAVQLGLSPETVKDYLQWGVPQARRSRLGQRRLAGQIPWSCAVKAETSQSRPATLTP